MEYLIIVVDHEKGFVGSRHVFREKYNEWLGDSDRERNYVINYLTREFPGITFDSILIIDNDLKIVEEWFKGVRSVHK